MIRRLAALAALACMVVTGLPGTASAATTITVPALADTYVSSSAPTTNYGTSVALRADDTGPVQYSYLRFDVAGVPAGATNVKGVLRVQGTGATQPSGTVRAHSVASNSWNSQTITYNTRPAHSSTVLDSATVDTGVTANLDVPVAGNGQVSFALTRSTTGAANVVGSKENTLESRRPVLLVTYDDPVVEPPPPAGGDHLFPYEDGSLWTRPIPADAPVSPSNTFWQDWLIANEPKDHWTLRVEPGQVTMNTVLGDCGDPIWKFPSTMSGPAGQEHLYQHGFHAPSDAFTGILQNSDTPFVIQDSCGNPARPDGFTIFAANVAYDGNAGRVLTSGGDGNITGGSFHWSTNGLDSRAPSSNAAPNENMISRGRIPETAVIRDELVRLAMANGGTGVVRPGAVPGTIGHTVEIFFIETNTAAGFKEPMVGDESGKAGCGGAAHPELCAEGQYIRVRPNWTPPAGCTGPALVVMRSLQHYGGYLGDNSGSGSGIKGEAGTTVFTDRDQLDPCMSLASRDLQILDKSYTP